MFKNFIIGKISGLVILLANSATITGCTLVFHEVDIPENLKKQSNFNK